MLEKRLNNHTIYLHDYDPDFSKVMQRLTTNIPDFKKQQGRVKSVFNNLKISPGLSSVD
jgi:hypothetical protein